jgi:hypothetical protein
MRQPHFIVQDEDKFKSGNGIQTAGAKDFGTQEKKTDRYKPHLERPE